MSGNAAPGTLVEVPVVASIFNIETGRELRVHVGGDKRNLIESMLSGNGDGPLEIRASELRAMLLKQGWIDERR